MCALHRQRREKSGPESDSAEEDEADQPLRQGERVTVIGLDKAKSYNWRQGVLESKEADRWHVRLSTGKVLFAKELNLRPVRRCASGSCRMPGARVACPKKCGQAFYCGPRCCSDDAFRHNSKCFPLDDEKTEPVGASSRLEALFREASEGRDYSWKPRVDTFGPGLDRLRFLKRVDAIVRQHPRLVAIREDSKSSILDALMESRKSEVEADLFNELCVEHGSAYVPCPVCMDNADNAGAGRGMCFTCGQSICAVCTVELEIACPPTGQQCGDDLAYEEEYPFARKCPTCNARFMPRCSELEHVQRMQRLLINRPTGRHVRFVLSCLGDCYLEGCDGLQPNENKAKEYYAQAVTAGSMESAVKLGKIAWRSQDVDSAVKWFRKAAFGDRSYGPARVQLAMLYIDSEYRLGTKDSAVDLLKRALRDTNEVAAYDTLRKIGVQAAGILANDNKEKTKYKKNRAKRHSKRKVQSGW